MTATTVPPPGSTPFGAAELQANSRRFFSRALTLSGAIHLAVLATVLALQARDRSAEPAWFLDPIHIIPSPPAIDRAVTAFDRVAPHPGPSQPKTGIVKPGPDIRIEVPNTRGVQPVDIGRKEPPAVGLPPSSGEGAVPCDPGETEVVPFDEEPIPTYSPTPAYPEWARDGGIQGRVILHVLVGRDGRVKRVTIIKDAMGLGESARATISRWLFRPALAGGMPVAVWVELPVAFRL